MRTPCTKAKCDAPNERSGEEISVVSERTIPEAAGSTYGSNDRASDASLPRSSGVREAAMPTKNETIETVMAHPTMMKNT